MWLLESDGEVFEGKKLWLRPGKRYLFGRTSNGAGSFAIPEKTISRKHLTIEVAEIPKGKGSEIQNRSTITIEDLETKLGTWVNGENIRSRKLQLTKDENELKLAKYETPFRITWRPVVLSFSFTKAELQQPDVWAFIQQKLEPLDIKYTNEYDSDHTTHLVSKKLGNTSKVLQALIDGKFFVSEGFIDAVVSAAAPQPDENGVETSELEDDFEGAWPKATKYLPPRAYGPGADRPTASFAPDRRRREIFDGYTFIFYEKRRFDDLFPVISSGKGKALMKEAVPGRTEIDDFIRHVKSIAGEKGLGEFEDGSEGRGVVVVRYVPSAGDPTDNWYLYFYNQVALRLDHRPIETRDFLPAILDVEPAQLRRALEVEPTPREPATQVRDSPTNGNAEGNEGDMEIDEVEAPPSIKESPPVSRRGRQRRAPKSRFKGFDHGSDNDDDDDDDDDDGARASSLPQKDDVTSQVQSLGALSRSQRKRPAPERDIMDEVAPTAAAIKRMRLEAGADPLPAAPNPPPPVAPVDAAKSPPQKNKAKGRTNAPAKNNKGQKGALATDDDYLNQFLQEGQEEEANLRAERELLQRELAEGAINFEEIRQRTAVETVEVRRLPTQQGLRHQGQQDERWDPKWNGLRNFKRFGRQGRQQPRNIIPLEPVATKESRINRDYWLEKGKRRDKALNPEATQVSNRSQTNGSPVLPLTTSARDTSEVVTDSEDDTGGIGGRAQRARNSSPPDVMVIEPAAAAPSRSRKGKAAEKASQTVWGATQKRVAAEPPPAEKPAKRRATTRATRSRQAGSSNEDHDEEDDDDDSEGEGLNFRFGKRK